VHRRQWEESTDHRDGGTGFSLMRSPANHHLLDLVFSWRYQLV
jgi:hypothetical protein